MIFIFFAIINQILSIKYAYYLSEAHQSLCTAMLLQALPKAPAFGIRPPASMQLSAHPMHYMF